MGSCPAFNPQIKCPSCDCTSPDFCKPKACATTPECSLCPLPNKTTYCAEKVEDPWFTKAMGKLSDREKGIAAAEAALSKEQAKRKFRNDIAALHRRAENEKTVLLLELDKQRKMLNDERFVNREKLDRRTFELFELKMKSREMFKEEWVAFEKKEKDRWAALNARQAANDEMEMRLRKEEVSIEADEDIVQMKQLKQDKEQRESLKAGLQGARMQVRNALLKKKAGLD